jgi:catechol 2,3-dioxygenase-like lactoylglutathione lyase family enzyme
MLTEANPKLPMRDKSKTRDFYIGKLGFEEYGNADYADYLMVKRDNVQIHFFSYPTLDPLENYGQVYIRTNDIESLYEILQEKNVIHPNGALQNKPWGQKEFAILDPDNNLLTFGQSL